MNDARGNGEGTDAAKSVGMAPGQMVGAGESGDKNSPPAPGVSQAADVIKRKRGRPPGSATRPATVAGPSPDELDAMRRRADLISDLCSPQNFRALVELPGDVGFAITGRKHWLLSEKESATLSSTASATAKTFGNIDPKWLAALMLLANVATIYGSRLVLDTKARREERARAEKQEADKK